MLLLPHAKRFYSVSLAGMTVKRDSCVTVSIIIAVKVLQGRRQVVSTYFMPSLSFKKQHCLPVMLLWSGFRQTIKLQTKRDRLRVACLVYYVILSQQIDKSRFSTRSSVK